MRHLLGAILKELHPNAFEARLHWKGRMHSGVNFLFQSLPCCPTSHPSFTIPICQISLLSVLACWNSNMTSMAPPTAHCHDIPQNAWLGIHVSVDLQPNCSLLVKWLQCSRSCLPKTRGNIHPHIYFPSSTQIGLIRGYIVSHSGLELRSTHPALIALP